MQPFLTNIFPIQKFPELTQIYFTVIKQKHIPDGINKGCRNCNTVNMPFLSKTDDRLIYILALKFDLHIPGLKIYLHSRQTVAINFKSMTALPEIIYSYVGRWALNAWLLQHFTKGSLHKFKITGTNINITGIYPTIISLWE